jgi:uncharacterized protein (DUF2236 family)
MQRRANRRAHFTGVKQTDRHGRSVADRCSKRARGATSGVEPRRWVALRHRPSATFLGVGVQGYFEHTSMIRRIHRERAVALSGPRALLMQAAHPLAVSGLLAHSSALDDPYDRLARTVQVVNTVVFGSRSDADRVTRRVRAMHRSVSGRLPDRAGRYPRGTPYRGDDPELLLWVLFSLVDSALVFYRKYVSSLSRADESSYWEDFKVFGRLFGVPSPHLPDTLDDLHAYRRRMLDGDELFVTDWARRRARQIVFSPPVSWRARPLLETVNFVTIALLPDPIRRQYGFSALPPPAVRKALVAVGAEYVKRGMLPFLPDQVRLVPSARRAVVVTDNRPRELGRA